MKIITQTILLRIQILHPSVKTIMPFFLVKSQFTRAEGRMDLKKKLLFSFRKGDDLGKLLKQPCK